MLSSKYDIHAVKKDTFTASEVKDSETWLHAQAAEQIKVIKNYHKLPRFASRESIDFYYGQHKTFEEIARRVKMLLKPA